MGTDAPEKLRTIGNIKLMNTHKTALFCSKNCPGDAILRTMDKAQEWRDQKRCIISGFHSPVEKECLKILLRGSQHIIICPAKSLEGMRIPKGWYDEIKSERILLLSFFDSSQKRLTAALSEKRNKLVAALSDDVFFSHISKGGKNEKLVGEITKWGIPVVNKIS